MLSPIQAGGMFAVLREELDVDPAAEPLFLAAVRSGAENIRFHGFSSRPRQQRPRLLLAASDLEHIRSPAADQRRLGLDERLRVVTASRRIADLINAPPSAPLGTRSRVSVLAA